MAIEDNKDYTLKGSQVKDLAGRVKENTSDIAGLESAVAGKQDELTAAQLAAVNSGIDADKVAQIATNANDIDSIEEKIPTEASALNKLADKAFVDGSIAIGSISVNGVVQTPDANKNVDLAITSPTVVQTIGTSTTDVMSQNAVSDLLFGNSGGQYDTARIKIGNSTPTPGNGSVLIGSIASAVGSYAIAIGNQASTSVNRGAVALGAFSQANAQGEFNIGIRTSAGQSANCGYNGSDYRLLSGVYDPQSAHDAATKGYVDNLIASLEARIAALEGN